MKKKLIFIISLTATTALFCFGCSGDEDMQNANSLNSYVEDVTDSQDIIEFDNYLLNSNKLDMWIGEYEYLYGTIPNHEDQKIVMYYLKIYQEDELYYAIFSMDGWLTSYEVKLLAYGDDEEILLIYDSHIRGSLYYENPIQQGDIFFKLKNTKSDVETIIGEVISELVHDVKFLPVNKSKN